jgi:uncharacterized protein YraI
VGLASTSLALFAIIVAAAIWRSFSTEEYAPTPTIPAEVASDFAYVSDMVGAAFRQEPGTVLELPVSVGDTIEAGRGALVRTGASSWMRLGFVNGTTVFLDENSEIEVRQVGDLEVGVAETVLQLNTGKMLAATGSDESLRLTVSAETGAAAHARNALLGLVYDRTAQRFHVHCLTGDCILTSQRGDSVALQQGESSWVQGFSTPFDVEPASYATFRGLGDPGMVPTETPVPAGIQVTPSRTSTRPTADLVTLEPSPTVPTFTPRPSPTVRVFGTATASSTATATMIPSPMISATVAPGSVTPTATASTATAVPATATLAATGTITATPTLLPSGTVVNARWLNVRSGPGTTYDVVGAVANGDKLILTGYRDAAADWVSIRQENGQEGWVHVYYVDTDTPVADLALWTGTSDTAGGQ